MIPTGSRTARVALVVALLAVATVVMPGWAVPPANAKCPPGTRALPIDLERSMVRWRGTKFWGRGEHSGTARFRGGTLCLAGAIPRAGWLDVDMRPCCVAQALEQRTHSLPLW